MLESLLRLGLSLNKFSEDKGYPRGWLSRAVRGQVEIDREFALGMSRDLGIAVEAWDAPPLPEPKLRATG